MQRADIGAVKRMCAPIFPAAKGRLGFLAECASGKGEHAASLGFVARLGGGLGGGLGGRLAGVLCCQVVEDTVLAPGAGVVGHVDLLAVSPRYRRRGVATGLWKRMESKLAARGIPSVWTRSRALRSGVDLMKYPGAIVFFLRMGFQKRQDIYDMTGYLDELDFDTSRDEARLRRQGIVVKRIEYGERDALKDFLAATFPNWIGTASAVTPDGPQPVHIARTSRGVIGFAASGDGWFGPIGVDPKRRLKGIGKVLLLRCLRDIRERGHKTASIGWANFPFYARAISAPVTSVLWQMEKKLKRP